MEQTKKDATKSQTLEITLIHRENEYEVIRSTVKVDLLPGIIIDYKYINEKLQYKIKQQLDINSKFLLGDTVTGKRRISQEKFIGKIIKKRGTVSEIELEDGQTFFLMNSEITKI